MILSLVSMEIKGNKGDTVYTKYSGESTRGNGAIVRLSYLLL